jgi:hypothetical protein
VGDYFQAMADVEVDEAGAPLVARAVVRWLVAEGIVDSTVSDCVLGADTGYPPGPHYLSAVDHADERLLLLRTNGLEVDVGRRVFYSTGGTGSAGCPRCERTVALQDPADLSVTPEWGLFSGALSRWYEGGSADVECPMCGRVVTFNDWRWPDDEPWAVGFLGFTFWNWPPLRASFVDRLAGRTGHRIVLTRGKL